MAGKTTIIRPGDVVDEPTPEAEDATEDPDAAGATEDGGGEDRDDTRPSGSKGEGLGLGIGDPGPAIPEGDVPRAESIRMLAWAGLYEGAPIDPWGVDGRPAVPVALRTSPVVPGGDLATIKEKMRLSRWRDAVTGRGDLPDPNLPPQVRHVLLTLSLWMNNDGSCAYPGTATLARAVGVTSRTLRRHLRTAEAGGWVKVVGLIREDDGRSSNLHVPGCPAGTFSGEGES